MARLAQAQTCKQMPQHPTPLKIISESGWLTIAVLVLSLPHVGTVHPVPLEQLARVAHLRHGHLSPVVGAEAPEGQIAAPAGKSAGQRWPPMPLAMGRCWSKRPCWGESSSSVR